MVGKNEAKILETQLITGFSGNKTTSESIQELIYPTEYEQPSHTGAPDPSLKSSVIPTAFNTRNCGSTLEFEPTISADGKSVNLRLVPELVWHTGNTVWLDTKDTQGNAIKVEMPDFIT